MSDRTEGDTNDRIDPEHDRFDLAGDDPVVVDGETLTPEDVVRIARHGAPVRVPERVREAVRTSRERVEEVMGTGDAVYGITTGFGDLVTERIPAEDRERLQTNLLRSHASGAGDYLDREVVRALLVTRLNALVKGYSGVREAVVDHLVAMLERGVHPRVRSVGSLGASGDLAPLAHAALVLVGEGAAEVDGEVLPGDEALARADCEPLSLAAKEGLALINGTQLTTAVASFALVEGQRVLGAADAAGALTTEVTMGTTAACDPRIHEIRPHAGQAATARSVRVLTEGSGIVASHRNCDRVQDAYSIRCLPQVHGAVRDALAHLRAATVVELNSATDNPLVLEPAADADTVLSGGNFHGEPLALRLDYATGALTELAAICERRIDRLCNPNVQEPHLPPYLTSESGTNSGYMIAQYTAAALVNECRSLGTPSRDSTPVSGGQEDHVSMSAGAARGTRRAVEHAASVVAVELCCATEAMRYVDDDLEPGPGTGAAADRVREFVPPLSGDRPLHDDIEAVATDVRAGGFLASVDRAVDGRLPRVGDEAGSDV